MATFGRPIWASFGVHLGGTRPPNFCFLLALGNRRVFFCCQVVFGSDFGASLDLILAVLGIIFDYCERAIERVLWPYNVFLVQERTLCLSPLLRSGRGLQIRYWLSTSSLCVDSLGFVTPRPHVRDAARRFRSKKFLAFGECANKLVLFPRWKKHQQQKCTRCMYRLFGYLIALEPTGRSVK